jgi:alanine racemase
VTPAAVAVIRPAALRNNLQQVRLTAPDCPVLAVIKANAYGHGLIQVARILDSADAFAVARLEEAVQLREAGICKRLVILGGCVTAEELRTAAELGIDIVVHGPEQLAVLEEAGTAAPVWCWLKVDTGMARLGMPVSAVPDAITRLHQCASVSGVTLMTHLACADDQQDAATGEQLACFSALLRDWHGDVSIANSAAILQWPDTLRNAGILPYTGRNWVRPGLMLFGASPIESRSAAELGLQPAMSFETRLISVKAIRKGQRVGYGGHWVAPRNSVLGLAAAGYADGYPWHARTGTPVGIGNAFGTLVGRVSMDMISIDITGVPGAAVGDRVVLWGDGPCVEEVAAAASTIPWTLMTGINRRVAVRIEAD